jgi:hypothetical protein
MFVKTVYHKDQITPNAQTRRLNCGQTFNFTTKSGGGKYSDRHVHTYCTMYMYARITVFFCVCLGNEGWRQIYKVELVRFTLMMYNILTLFYSVERVGVCVPLILSQYRNHFSVPNLMIEFVTQNTVFTRATHPIYCLIDKLDGKV